MFEKLVNVLNTFVETTTNGQEYFPASEGDILSALIEILQKAGFTNYIYNGYNFDGGPGYEAEYFVLTWFEDNSLHSIDWVEECF